MRPAIRESVVWRREVRRTRACALTPEEQESVRRVLRVLRHRAGDDMRELAKMLDMPYQSVRHVFVGTRSVSMKTAFKVAKAARLSITAVLGAKWAKTAVCPLCGRRG